MARTAPVPNIPAIPGMNPGIFVLGGGGDGGGSGEGGGNGAKNKQGANGKNGGNDANGGGPNANGCGAGSPGACTNCGNNMSAGDPVDVATGAVTTLPSLDVKLPGPLPLEVWRCYSTHSIERDVGLGWGWSCSLSWEIVARRRTVQIWDENGSMLQMDMPEMGATVIGPKGRLLTREAWGFALEIGGLTRKFAEPTDDKLRYLLTAIEDRNGNRISLAYDQGRLVEVTDSVGRVVRVRRAYDGRIASFEMKNAPSQGQWFPFARYSHDADGNLVTFTDPLGAATHYTYGEDHLLTSFARPDRPVFHFVYDAANRCTETWGAFANGAVPGLAASVPPVLADGKTRAKGFMHARIEYGADGYREVIDSLQVRRFDTNEHGLVERGVSAGNVTTRVFDARGFMISHTDAAGATTEWVLDELGRMLKRTDPLGNTLLVRRNALGLPLEAEDSLGKIMSAEYDARGNVVRLVKAGGETTVREYDARGNVVRQILPAGTQILYEYDPQGNNTAVVDPDGTAWRYGYDVFGRCVSQTDPRGLETRFVFDDKSRLIATYYPNGGVERRMYNGVDELTGLVECDGQVWQADYLVRRMIRVVKPDGSTMQYKYDREGHLLELHNELGEVRSYKTNLEGFVTECRSFNGRVTHYGYDAKNRLVEYTNGRGEKTTLERDLEGQIVKIAYPDDVEVGFEYDLRGQLVRAVGPVSEHAWDRNVSGGAIRETVVVDGEIHVIAREFDLARTVTRVETDLGHVCEIGRDERGRPRSYAFEDGERLDMRYDPVGRELERAFAGGAVQTSEYGPEGGYRRRRVVPAGAPVAFDANQPDWVADRPSPASVDKSFQYSLNAETITRRWDKSFGDLEFVYDAREQVRSVQRGVNILEQFSYDSARNVHETAGSRSYRAGNVLERKGKTTYEWDDDGCLVAKKVMRPDGAEDLWRYEWNGQGFLSKVIAPDGAVTEFGYDPFGRRMLKKRTRRTATDTSVEVAKFLWNEHQILHEIRKTAAASGDPVITQRTYVHSDHDKAPVAHRDDVIAGGVKTPGQWVYYVNDPIGTPEHLVSSDGRVVGEMRRSTWGVTTVTEGSQATTPIRFRGQYEDAETGLFYNRYRYYDPETGRYISEDPAGNVPDANLFAYGINPISVVDPFGLAHNADATFTPAGGTPTSLGNFSSSYNSETDDYSRGYNAQNGITPFQNLTARDAQGNLIHRTSDTEAQIIREMERRRDQEGLNLEGGHLQINGTLPPCTSCHRRMAQFAADNKCKVTYNWTGNPASNIIANRTPGSQVYT